jgi:hypothetical protein
VRMGQWGFSNQVSHHIPYMYDYVGQPYKTAEKVREALRRLYVGSEIGQGYAGDEDNGETSAWYLFSSLGLYPLQVGSENYAIGSPLFKRATVHLDNGRKLTVKAHGNSARNIYVQGLRLNGRRIDRAYVRHSEIARGGTLEFTMGPRPSRWATSRSAAPPSITRGSEIAHPLRDQTSPDDGRGPLFDDDSSTTAPAGAAVEYAFAAKRRATFYTLTSGTAAGGDPSGWVLEGSNDGSRWTTLDERSGEAFRWRSQTRPFKVKRPGSYTRYRLRFRGAAPTLGEIELLQRQAPDTSPLVASAEPVVAGAGESATVAVKLTNHGASPASGTVTATGPAGWTVDPASASFGPLAPGASTTVSLHAAVPADAAPGTYAVRLAIASNLGNTRDSATIAVVGDTIEFTPGTDAETPWLFDADGSQLDGAWRDGRGRFTDNETHATYRFQLPADVTGGTLTLEIGNEFVVDVSTDGSTWREVLREPTQEHDQGNRAERTLDLNDLRAGGHTLYVRLGDAKPDDGWGGWLGHVKLVMRR